MLSKWLPAQNDSVKATVPYKMCDGKGGKAGRQKKLATSEYLEIMSPRISNLCCGWRLNTRPKGPVKGPHSRAPYRATRGNPHRRTPQGPL